MDHFHFLRDLVVLMSLAVLVVVACYRVRVPPIVGFLITGVIAGPTGLGLIKIESVQSLAEIGVVLLLFTIGIELSLEKLARMRSALIVGGGLQVALTLTLASGVAHAFGLAWDQSILIGMLVALSSTAIVLKLLSDRAEVDSPQGRISLGILIFQDLCVVPMVIAVPFLAGKGGSASEWVLTMGRAVLLVAGALVCGRFAVPWVLGRIVRTRSREVFLFTVVLLCLGAAWLTSVVGLSLALGAFIAGLVVSQSQYSHQALGEILPFRDVFASIFLISIGMLLDLKMVLDPSQASRLALVVLSILAVKSLVAWGVTLILRYPFRVAVLVALPLSQVGEFSFVLADLGLKQGLIGQTLYNNFLAASVITMMLTPLLRSVAPWVADRLTPWMPASFLRGPRLGASPDDLHHIEGHVVIMGFGLNGRNLARALKSVSIGYVVIEMNPETVAAEQKKGEPIIYGDASSEHVLEHAGVRRARVLVIAVSDPTCIRRSTHLARRMHPGLHIIVRTRFLGEIQPLLQLGANEVVPEEFETALEIFSRTLRKLLVPRDVVEKFVREARTSGYGVLLEDQEEKKDDVSCYLAGASVEVLRVEPGSSVAGKTIGEADLRRKTGATVLGLRQGQDFTANPSTASRLDPGMVAVVFGTAEQVTRAAALFREGTEPRPEPEPQAAAAADPV